ncbi:MAG: rhodanese-related sulfurtransferase [Alphaproteobacteria bacterium]|nr:MAG: rhodanese-related sulfurtransferase [Alphaproteobacteria bacterium]
MKHKIVAFYKFQAIQPEEIKAALMPYLKNIKGTVLLAREGINGTVSGPDEDIDRYGEKLKELFPGLSIKFSYKEGQTPFYRLKVRFKKEIVTLRAPEADPCQYVGEYVEPKDWNKLISDPDVICIDTRNDYEVKMGTFKGAINPKTEKFTEIKDYVAQNCKDKEQKIAMVCTGGIRCERSTAYMKALGFKHVYHLNGGILKYLEDVEEKDSLWEGECFVFDHRIGVKHGLKQGDYQMCYGCRMPLSQEEMQVPEYEEGVSCAYCSAKTSEDKKARLRQRQRQIELFKSRGQEHLGQTRPTTSS